MAESRETGESLREHLEHYRLIFETAALGIGMGPANGLITEANPAFCEMLGRTPEELAGQSAMSFGHPDDEPTTLAALGLLRSGETDRVQYDKRFIRKDGTVFWAHTTLGAMRGPEGEIVGIVATLQDISGQRAMEQALRDADRRKDEFLAMLGHELRNPLAPIRNAIHILNGTDDNPALHLRARQILSRQAKHMTRLIEDLLDVSRISQRKVLLRKKPLDLVELVRITTEDHRNELEAASLVLEIDLPPEPVWVEGDPTRLAQAVGNLLHNARKFTDPGGLVTICVEEDEPGMAAVVLCDTGIGMEPDLLERLFETFTQADRSLDRSRGGLGLGLALVRGLIELHGGSVSAESAGPGCGSKFTLRLPRAAAAPEADGETEAAPPPRSDRRRVLVIEDHQDAAESLQLLLELQGYRVEIAFNGVDGLDSARLLRPDVVLCDVGLPNGMDGYAVARAFRADSDLGSCYLVALTGYGQAEDQRLALEAGFDRHLTKPVDLEVLQRVLAEAV